MKTKRKWEFLSAMGTPADSLGFQLWRAVNLWQRRMKKVLSPLKLTPVQFMLLTSVGYHQANNIPANQSMVASHVRMDPMMTSEVLRKLEKRDIVERNPHPEDSRAKQVMLTDKGKRIVVDAIDVVQALEGALYPGPADEKQLLKHGIQRLLEREEAKT